MFTMNKHMTCRISYSNKLSNTSHHIIITASHYRFYDLWRCASLLINRSLFQFVVTSDLIKCSPFVVEQVHFDIITLKVQFCQAQGTASNSEQESEQIPNLYTPNTNSWLQRSLKMSDGGVQGISTTILNIKKMLIEERKWKWAWHYVRFKLVWPVCCVTKANYTKLAITYLLLNLTEFYIHSSRTPRVDQRMF